MFGGSEKIGTMAERRRSERWGDHSDPFRSIPILPILPILPIPNDTAVFGLTGEARAGLVLNLPNLLDESMDGF
jgi:hypothetical protein